MTPLTAELQSRDRPARNPANRECEQCKCTFTGEAWHNFCAVCIEAIKEVIWREQHEH